MKVTRLYIYPVKSLAGIEVNTSLVTDRGLEFDRRWVLVDENNYHVTQRELPVLLSFQPEIKEDHLVIKNCLNGEDCVVPFQPNSKRKEQIKVWDDVFNAQEVSEELSLWFSRAINKRVRLMFQSDDSRREIDSKFAVIGDEIVSAADGYPILIISEESLKDLNGKLAEPVEMLRFRPNIVINGIEAFGEDNLTQIRIGEAEIIGVKNCARCIMTTNKLDGSPRNKEPLKTLSQYRRLGKKVLFGRNFLIAKEGEVMIGSEVLPL